MSDYPYQFQAKVVEMDFGRMKYSVLYVPKKVLDQLPLDQHPRLRVNAEIDGVPIEAAFQPKDGKRYIMMSKRRLKMCGLALGDTAQVEFEIADQTAVTVPNELVFALEANQDAAQIWEKLTPGKQRGLAYYVASAKRVETRERRVDEGLEMIRDL